MSSALDTAGNSGMLTGMATTATSRSTTASSRPASSPRDDAAERPPHLAAREPEPGSPASLLAGVGKARTSTDTATCEAAACILNPASFSDPVLPEAQRRWAARPLVERLQPIRKARHWIAAHPEAFAKAISSGLARSQSDTLTAEVLPLLDAMRFLERNARTLLTPRKLGNSGRPLWLTGVQAEIHRDPLGHILVIGPANFPLFLAGVQTVQALVAGNAVTWKPGAGGGKVALLLAHALREAGLPRGILHITGESIQDAQTALAENPDKVIFTGAFDTGRHILRNLAETATPSVMELSGADAVIVLPSADLPLTAKAVAFGLRLNGAEVCMSPRRLVGTRETLQALRPFLQTELAAIPPVHLNPRSADTLGRLLQDAVAHGGDLLPLTPRTPALAGHVSSPPELISVSGVQNRPYCAQPAETVSAKSIPSPSSAIETRPILLDHATSDTAIARADIFAPVLSLIEAPSVLHMADIVNNNPYALAASIFGNPREAQTLATQLRVGTVTINDLIAPTTDPRVPFGGRANSGFGTTRGAEGLLEMTAAKTVLTRRKGTGLHYDPLQNRDLPLFAALIGSLHAGSLKARLAALRHLVAAIRTRAQKPRHQAPATSH